MSEVSLVLQVKNNYKWTDTEFVYQGAEADHAAAKKQATLAAEEITRNTGSRTRIIRRVEEPIEEFCSADFNKPK
jgi:hypothetical protein